MNNKVWLIILFVLLIACGGLIYLQKLEVFQPQTQNYQPSQEKIFIEKPSSKPSLPPPSESFMKGYWDGYNGTWLGPVRWLVKDDYRQGWNLGNKDRINNIQRFSPPEKR